MDNDIRSQAERALAVGGSKSIIHREPGAVLVNDCRNLAQVDHFHGGVGGQLGIRKLAAGVGFESRLPALWKGIIQPDDLNPELGDDAVNEI